MLSTTLNILSFENFYTLEDYLPLDDIIMWISGGGRKTAALKLKDAVTLQLTCSKSLVNSLLST